MIEMKIILVGLGHEMHGDDEIGLEVVRTWSEKFGDVNPGVQIALLESPGLNLLGTIAGLDAAIFVAATRSGAPVGTVQILEGEELSIGQEFSQKISAWGAAETLSLGKELSPEDLPERLVLLGIEGAAFGLGEGLSPAVRAAIPQALSALDQILEKFEEKRFNIRTLFKKFITHLIK
jgi:hydrogenase maturation protease